MHGGSGNLANLANELDGTVSSLMTDLRDRGMLDSTMIVVTSEFGRTPKVKSNGGRDHHPNGFSAMLAGGGIKGGIAVGETDRNGRDPFPEFEPKNLHATIAEALGMTGTKIRRPGTPFLPRRKTQANQGNPRLIVPYDGRFPLPKEIDRKLDRFQNVAGYPPVRLPPVII